MNSPMHGERQLSSVCLSIIVILPTGIHFFGGLKWKVAWVFTHVETGWLAGLFVCIWTHRIRERCPPEIPRFHFPFVVKLVGWNWGSCTLDSMGRGDESPLMFRPLMEDSTYPVMPGGSLASTSGGPNVNQESQTSSALSFCWASNWIHPPPASPSPQQA